MMPLRIKYRSMLWLKYLFTTPKAGTAKYRGTHLARTEASSENIGSRFIYYKRGRVNVCILTLSIKLTLAPSCNSCRTTATEFLKAAKCSAVQPSYVKSHMLYWIGMPIVHH